MIDASFDRSSRLAAVSGVYQYDTGQRLRMHGLPSPDELLARDNLLAGSVLTVQVQFGYIGDEQTDTGLATWDDENWIWIVDIPDEYLTRTDPVHVYVYVFYGANEYGERANTMYEGVFTPISRPAPGNVASDDMLERWNDLKAEVGLVLSPLKEAAEDARDMAEAATTKAEDAMAATEELQEVLNGVNDAINQLEDVEQSLNNLPIQAESLPAGSDAYAVLSEGVLRCGIPRGHDGVKGGVGDVGPSDIAISFSDGVLTITPNKEG